MLKKIVIILILFAGVISMAKSNNEKHISSEAALEIAKKAIGCYQYSKTEKITIELKNGIYYIAFPFLNQGRKTNGAFDALRVQIDSRSGNVLKIVEDPN